MFARLLALQLSSLRDFPAEERATITLPTDVFAYGDVTASLGGKERIIVYQIYRMGSQHLLRLIFSRSLQVDLSFSRPTPPPHFYEEVKIPIAIHVFKDGAQILNGPYQGDLVLWAENGAVYQIAVEIKDAWIVLNGAPFNAALSKYVSAPLPQPA